MSHHAWAIDPTHLSLPNGRRQWRVSGAISYRHSARALRLMGIDIATPPAVAGFGPKVSLEYDSGSGASELGMAGTRGLPSVRRRTENGLPRFDASDAIEVTGLGLRATA